MKKYIGFVIMAGLMFSTASAVLAEENSGTSNTSGTSLKDTLKAEREAFKESLKARKEALKERTKADREAFRAALKEKKEAFDAEVKAKKEEFKKANAEKKDEFRKKADEIIGKRFESAFKNLEKTQARVGELLSELAAAGKDTSLASDFIESSKQKLAEATAKIAELKALLPATGEATTSEIFEKIKLGAREAKDLLKESQNDLKQALKELKTLREGETEDSD